MDVKANRVTTYLYIDFFLNSATVSDAPAQLACIRSQDFEQQKSKTTQLERPECLLDLSSDFCMDELLRFNETFLSQVWANIFPQQFDSN